MSETAINTTDLYIGLSLDKVWSDLKTLKNLFWEGHRPLPYIIDVILDVGEGFKLSLKLYIYQSNCSLSESPNIALSVSSDLSIIMVELID
ncbi:MAG: hypothetical protein Phog2KO_31340 [Phototrophicaceae bacterium]